MLFLYVFKYNIELKHQNEIHVCMYYTLKVYNVFLKSSFVEFLFKI